MKKLIIFVLMALYVNCALAQEEILSKKISISFQKVTLIEALNQLKDKHNVPMAFNSKHKELKTVITQSFDNQSIEAILITLFTNTGLDFKLIDNQVVVYEKKTGNTSQEQNNSSIQGMVVDEETGFALPFINVVVANTFIGSVTDENGRFKIDNLHSGLYNLIISSIGYTDKTISEIEIKENQHIDLGTITFKTETIKLSEVVIGPGTFSVMGSQKMSVQTLSDKDLKNMSWAEDITRAVTRLPGVSSNDFSSKFTVRGGESDEVLIELDGMELYEPFHQRDFVGGLFSIVDIETIQSVNLFTGGFGAEFGQRQSAVFQLKTKKVQDDQSHNSVGFSVMNIRAYTDGNFSNNKGKYLISARRGILDWSLKAVGLDETIPTYYDALAKIEYQLNDKHLLTFHNLFAGDKMAVNDIKPDNYDRNRTKYTNNYSWLTLKTNLTEDVSARTILYGGLVTHDRNGLFHKRDYADKGDFSLSDKRNFTFAGLKQDWNFDFSNKFALKTGFDFRQQGVDYDYQHSISEVRVNPQEELYTYSREVNVQTKPSGLLFNLYASGKALITEKLIGEFGLRYDRASYANDNLISPRTALSYSFSDRSFLRAAYGHYYQSQFINNLDVNHNTTTFNKAELSKHYVLGFEHQFKNNINFRIEAYYKDISRISPMYENLRDPWETFPESRNDVLKLDVANASSKGIEFFAKYDQGNKISWWFSYALAKAEDEIRSIEFDGIYEEQLGKLARPLNQTHTVYADINYRFNPKWHLNFSWQFYQGLPLTTYDYAWQRLPPENQLGQETAAIFPDGDLQFYPKHHLYRGSEYPAYHKADVRVNRIFQMEKSRITGFLHIINLYNHFNLRKFDLGVTNGDEMITPDGNGGYVISQDNTSWFGSTPIFGISWEF